MCGSTGSGEHDVSSAQVAEVHSVNNCMDLDKHHRVSAVAARAVGVLNSDSRACGWGPG